MRILYVDLSPGIGGSLLSLERLLSRLDRDEFAPMIALAAHNPAAPRFRALGVPVLPVPTFVVPPPDQPSVGAAASAQFEMRERLRAGGITRYVWASLRSARNILTRTLPLTWRLIGAMRAARPDLVHVNDAIFVSRPALAAARIAGVPAVCHVRSLNRLGALDRFWARSVRRFIFISRWVADDVVAQGIPANRGRLIYDGLDTSRYSALLDRSAACAALGIAPDRPTVAVVGRLVPWKGQELFLRAMRRVVAAMPGAQGLIVGDVESFSRDFGDRLRALRAELGLDAAVHLLGHLADPSPVYAAVDLLAHTSVTPEPFGLVMIEAMASGLPVVTPAEGGGPEIVVDGVTGRLFAPGNPDALAAAILELLRDPQRARTMGAAGRARVQQCFTLDGFAAEMTAFYRSLRLPRGAA